MDRKRRLAGNSSYSPLGSSSRMTKNKKTKPQAIFLTKFRSALPTPMARQLVTEQEEQRRTGKHFDEQEEVSRVQLPRRHIS